VAHFGDQFFVWHVPNLLATWPDHVCHRTKVQKERKRKSQECGLTQGIDIAMTYRPQSASSVQACIYSFQFQYTFLVLNFSPAIIERTSVELVFFVLALSVLVLSVPLVILMFRSVAKYDSDPAAPKKS
jgi:hypothetical protein